MVYWKNFIKRLRRYRVIHRYFGLSLSIFLLISALTGLLLAWKKNVDWIQPPTQKGVATDLSGWKSIDELSNIAVKAFQIAHPALEENPVDRLDVRPSKGIVKVLLEKGYWEVQLDGVTGEVLSIAQRHSDWIEALHDGSIVSQSFKLLSMNGLSIGLFVMIISGFWLWYGPKLLRRRKRRSTLDA